MRKAKIETKTQREPLFHIVKKSSVPLWQSLLIRLLTIVIALFFAGLITLVIFGGNAITVFKAMFQGVFGANTLRSFRSTAILLCIALALTPAFKMRFWNTGAEGQVLMGCLASAFCMYYFYELPTFWLITLMLVVSLVAGTVWGIIPAIFKAIWGTNETLFTLMMNSVASCLTVFFMKFWKKDGSSVGNQILDPDGKIKTVLSTNYWAVIITVLVVAAIMFVYLKYSKHGYEISVVGESENTARYVGINVKKVIIRTMAISGLICGLAGFLIVAPSRSIAGTSVGGQGFTAIMVAWLAKFNPLIMIPCAFLFIFVSVGGQEVSTLGFDPAYSDILIGVLLFFIIGCEFFINYKLVAGARLKKLFKRKENILSGEKEDK